MVLTRRPIRIACMVLVPFAFSLLLSGNMNTSRIALASGGSIVGTLCHQKRFITRLYTSYHAGRLFPNQMVMAKQRVPSQWKRDSFKNFKEPKATLSGDEGEAEVTWEEENTDAIHSNTKEQLSSEKPRIPQSRPYFPLGRAARVELQGDYLTEGGLHQEALEHYGVVARAYELAYPTDHPQNIGVLLKVGGALRRTNRLESSKHNLLNALKKIDESSSPHMELIVECLLELGLTKEALGEADAGSTFEEGVQVMREFYDFGASHKMLRLLPNLSRRFNLNFEEKFLYFSPFDYDRTFALADQCLLRAERFYRSRSDQQGVVRVLETRIELVNKKFFNMRQFAGRIHTMRGHWMRRARTLTDAPTPDELLRYSPTIHQVHRDFQYELNAPIGREDEVAGGTNRVVLDAGNPYRRRGRHSKEMMRDAEFNYQKYVNRKEYND